MANCSNWVLPWLSRRSPDIMVRRRGPPSQTWLTFLRNHALDIAAIDLFVVPTLSFELLYGLVGARVITRLRWKPANEDKSLNDTASFRRRASKREIDRWTCPKIRRNTLRPFSLA